MSTLRVDFVSSAVAYRLKHGGGRGEAIAKAVGFGKGKVTHVVDATAGLGRDAFLLASLGAEVTMIERSPQMHALLQAGLEEALQAGGESAEIASRMTLLYGDAKDLLPQLKPEIIVIDPMHPPRKSSSLVKLDLRQVREIVGSDEDSLDLMRVALQCATKRVVLKWPRKGDSMEGIRKPSHQLIGKSTRYDVFMTPTTPVAP